MKFSLKANLIDIINREIYPAAVTVEDGKIKKVQKINEVVSRYILPGFIDSHVHIESSLMVPSEFVHLAVKHGTVATISDPHEIANVLGIPGVEYMINNDQQVPFHFFFGAPSCVPATKFETAGAEIDANGIEDLLSKKEVVYLAEMMNYPGVIYKDEEVVKKLTVAKKLNKPIDGHAPGLMGELMKHYFDAGISTDHECFKYEEAKEKLEHGVLVQIREGSAAKNFDALIPLIKDFPEQIMFCCDDKHPDSLIENHINQHVIRALNAGYNLFDVLRASSYNIIKHYHLPVGLLREQDSADFIMIDHPESFQVLQTYIRGQLVMENGQSLIQKVKASAPNFFSCSPKQPKDFKLKTEGHKIRVIEALDGQLITHEIIEEVKDNNGYAESNVEKDILKIAVINRYRDVEISRAFIKNIGLKKGAIASCVAHDCHNIVVVGTNDDDMCRAVNLIIEAKGGLSVANGHETNILELPVAGIMSNLPADEVVKKYIEIDQQAKSLGTSLRSPFMTLSFMALLVIPELKLSDKGLFNGKDFSFTKIFVD